VPTDAPQATGLHDWPFPPPCFINYKKKENALARKNFNKVAEWL